jgi:Antitoxin Phd_YefM, type II toxin-antitoxin system
MRISTAEFLKNYGVLADKALGEAVVITKNGRDRLVVVSAEEYVRLKRRDRRPFPVGALTDAQIAALEMAEVPAEYAYLDAEMTEEPR